MYNEFYRLKEEPFSITPDPRYWFVAARHREALEHLLYGIRQRRGFIMLTGEVGAGKTTLCRVLLDNLPAGVHTALILNPVLSETQLVRAALAEFGVTTKQVDRLRGLELLNRFLLETNSAGQDAVLIIDEAQDMPDKTLEMARLLSNLETETQKLLQIVLVGQPELRDKIRKPRFRQLSQRITVRYHLETLTYDETAEYLNHRLKTASARSDVAETVSFDPAAIREIYGFSGGTPRLINAVTDKALLAGYVYNTWRIDRGMVKTAIRELREAG
jgi:general secretion pathway protein A